MNNKSYKQKVDKFLDTRIPYVMDQQVYPSDKDTSAFYYNPSDKEIVDSNGFEVYAIKTCEPPIRSEFEMDLMRKKQYLQTYKDRDVYVDPNTYRYQADLLFRKLIDYCDNNKLTYLGSSLVNKTMRDKFYSFCYQNTYKNNTSL